MKTMDAYIYTNNFNPFDVTKNMLRHNGDFNNRGQFQLTAALQANMKYVFVMTTSASNVTGNVSIQVSGRSQIDFDRILNTSSVVQTIYASELTTNSSNSYYEAILVNVRRSGLYTFLSKSYMDTYGGIHKDYFNPSSLYENRIGYDDDSCQQQQFKF
ncbi:unnamed protein product, partial [Adineta steineri]